MLMGDLKERREWERLMESEWDPVLFDTLFSGAVSFFMHCIVMES